MFQLQIQALTHTPHKRFQMCVQGKSVSQLTLRGRASERVQAPTHTASSITVESMVRSHGVYLPRSSGHRSGVHSASRPIPSI